MPFIEHLPELFVVLLIALLVFGPKRMIEMGSSLGKAFREFRESVRDIPGMDGLTNLGGILREDAPPRPPYAPPAAAPAQPVEPAAPATPPTGPTVDATMAAPGDPVGDRPRAPSGEPPPGV